jgi:uncharacterized membrane protein YqhA
MNKILDKARYVMVLPIIGLYISAFITLVLAFGKSATLISDIAEVGTGRPTFIVSVLSIIDIFLISTVQVVVALGMTSLFFNVKVTKNVFAFNSLSELKTVVSELVILVLAIKFVEKVFQSKESIDLLWTGIAIGVVSLVLVAFTYIAAPDHTKETS